MLSEHPVVDLTLTNTDWITVDSNRASVLNPEGRKLLGRSVLSEHKA